MNLQLRKKFRSYIFLQAFVWILIVIVFHATVAVAESLPIQIRFTAANFNVYKNTDTNNSGISVSQSKAAFDLVWDANVDTETGYLFISGAAHVLFGSGETTIVPPSGPTCTRPLTYDTDEHVLIIKPNQPAGNFVTIQIPQPAAANNNGNTAALDYKPNSAPFACGVPQAASFLSGEGATRSIVFSPTEQLLPSDGNLDSAGETRAIYAVVRFNAKALPATIYTTFVYNGSVGTISTKNVWFGRVEVTPHPNGLPQAVDPFFLGGYHPPANLGDLPEDPPAQLAPSTPVKYSDFVKWEKKLFPPIQKGFATIFSQMQTNPSASASTNLPSGAQFSYDPLTSFLTAHDVIAAPPGPGKLSLNVVFKDATTDATTFKASVPTSAIKTSLAGPDKISFSVLLSPKIKRALASHKAYVAFVSVKFAANTGGKAVISSTHFKVKARKKPRR